MKNLVSYIAKAIVDNPDEVDVQEIRGEKTTVIELKVAAEDMGKIIGKHGKTAKAIRAILSATATRDDKKVVLEILD